MLVESKKLEKILHQYRRRVMFLNWLRLGMEFLIGSLFLITMVEILLPSIRHGDIKNYVALYLPALALLAAALVALIKNPSLSALAKRTDRFLRLDQRLETAWEVRERRNEEVRFLLKDTLSRLEKTHPKSLFPMRWRKVWLTIPPLLFLYFLSVYHAPLFNISFFPRRLPAPPVSFIQEGMQWQKLTEKGRQQGWLPEDKDPPDLVTMMKTLSDTLLSLNPSVSDIFEQLHGLREQVHRLRSAPFFGKIKGGENKEEQRMKLDRYLDEISQEADKIKERLAASLYARQTESHQLVNKPPLPANFQNLSNRQSQILSSQSRGGASGMKAGSGKGEKGTGVQNAMDNRTGGIEEKKATPNKDVHDPLLVSGVPEISASKGIPTRGIMGGHSDRERVPGEIFKDEISEIKTSPGNADRMTTQEHLPADTLRIDEYPLPHTHIPPHLKTYIRNYFLALADLEETKESISAEDEKKEDR